MSSIRFLAALVIALVVGALGALLVNLLKPPEPPSVQNIVLEASEDQRGKPSPASKPAKNGNTPSDNNKSGGNSSDNNQSSEDDGGAQPVAPAPPCPAGEDDLNDEDLDCDDDDGEQDDDDGEQDDDDDDGEQDDDDGEQDDDDDRDGRDD